MATDYKFRITAKDQTKGAFNSVNSTQAAMKKLAGAFAGVFAVRQIVMFGNEALALADTIGKVADSIGVSTEFLQKYQFAAEQSGVATEEFNKGMQMFAKMVGQAQLRTTEAGRTLEKLGIQLKNADGSAKDAETIFEELFVALDSVGSQLEKDAILADLFSRAGVKMAVMAKDGSEMMKALAESATGIISDETIDNAEAFNDTMNRLKRQVLVPLQSAFINTTKAILDFAEAMGLIKPDLFTKSMDELNAMLTKQSEIIEKNERLIKRFGAVPEFTMPLDKAKEQLALITEAIARKKKAEEVQKKLNTTLDDGTESSDNFNKSFTGAMEESVTVVKTFAETVEGQLTNAFTDFFDFASKEFLDFKNLATNVARAVINELIQIFIVKRLVGMVQGSITSFTQSFQGGTGASVDLTGGSLDAMSSAATQVQTASPTVNFNISTVDAAGFDQLLTSRKGTITTIINDAMNNQGKMGII
jgi:hypothetical protein